MAVAVVFPGQGAQRPGLGQSWRAHEAWSVVERAEAVLERPLAPLLLDADASLDRTEDAQMAVLLHSLMAWERVLEASDPELVPPGTEPVAFAGHSLGQMTALIAAGVLSFEDGIRLAALRARHTQEAADSRPGEMAALLGADLEQAEEACAAAPEACWLANDNAPGQVVIAGTPDGLESATERAREIGIRRITGLRVGGAFHTPLMQEAATALEKDLQETTCSPSSVPVVSNGDARPYQDGDGWRQRLVNHLVRPVRWRESVQTLVSLGAAELIEVGPGTTLAGLAKRTVPDLSVQSIESTLEEVGV